MSKPTLKKQFRAPPKRCAYCDSPATTRDHVPPKAILRKPFKNLITVPACAPCNGQWAAVDERFRNVLSLVLGDHTEESKEFWDTRVLPGVQQGGPATKILRAHGPGTWSVDAKDAEPMLKRLTRGLIYATLKIPLPTYIPIEAHMLLDDGGPTTLSCFTENGFKHRKVGEDFRVWYGFYPKEFTSWWLMSFFRSVYALSVTGGAAERSLAVPGPGKVQAIISGGKLFKGPIKPR